MTVIVDYGTLQTAIDERLGDDTLSSFIPGWIDLCRQRVSRDVRAFFDETDVEITIDDQTVALPDGFVEQRRHYIDIASTSTGGIQRVEYMSPERLWDYDLLKAAQLPKFYTIEGRNLVFSPSPDTEYTGQWLIWQNPTAFSADTDTNTLLTEHSGIYLYGSLIEAESHLEDDPRILVWATMYQEAVDAVNDMSERARHPRGQKVSRSKVPISSGGRTKM